MVNGVEELHQWKRERTERGRGLGLKACSGCQCIRHKEGPKKQGKGVVKAWVWGEGGGVVTGTQRRGKWDGRGEREKCMIVATSEGDAKACCEEGGRCMMTSKGKELCLPHVVNKRGKPVVVKKWGKGVAGGEGCVGCRYQAVIGGAWKGRREGEGNKVVKREKEENENEAQGGGEAGKRKKEGITQLKQKDGGPKQKNKETKQKEGDTAKRKEGEMDFMDFLNLDDPRFEHLEAALPGSL